MQSYSNDIPLGPPEEAKNRKELIDKMMNAFDRGADEVRVMTAEKAAERKRQYREWRKALRCKPMSAPGKRKL